MACKLKPLSHFPLLFLCLTVLAGGARADEPAAGFDEFRARMALEFGHLVSGELHSAGTRVDRISNLPLNRNIITLENGGQYGDDLYLQAGLMGILWWPFSATAGPPGGRTVRVEPRLSVLRAREALRFAGDSAFIEAGYFPYKYNPDSRNLGEYLYRSGTYPGVVYTNDGFQLMDHSYFDAFGIHSHFSSFDGRISQEINLFVEPTVSPLSDITPGYELSLSLPRFTMGIGAAYNHGISYRPSENSPHEPFNSYIEVPADSAKGYAYYKGPFLGAPASVKRDTTKPYRVLSYWSQRGLKLDVRMAIYLGFLITDQFYTHDALRFYSEAAILGWENRPYFYEKRTERMPVLFGVNLPTFRCLDLLSFEAEYYNAQFNDVDYYTRSSLPIWKVLNYTTRDQEAERSKWKWSVYGRKSINRLVSIKGQFASDHLRLRDFLTYYSEYEMTLQAKNWYYLVQLEVGI